MKKVVFLICLLFVFMIPSSVEAKKGNQALLIMTSPPLKLTDSSGLSGTFPIATLNGNRVLCLDMGKNLVSETYTNTGIQASDLAKKAYNFLKNNLANNRYYEQIGAQMLAWGRGDIGNLSAAYGILYGNDRAGDEIAENIVNNMKNFSSTGNYCIWEPATAGNQRVIAPCDGGSTPGGGGGTTPSNCNPTSQIGGCGSSSSFKDPTSWSCIAGNSKYQDNSTVKNKYCEIFCQEQVNTSFPGNNFQFLAGQYFTVQNDYWGHNNAWGPVSISGTRTCKMYYKNGSTYTPGVNYAGWLKDFNTMDNDVKNAYNAWQKENARVNNKIGGPQRVGECQVGTKPVEKKVGPATCKDKNSKIGVTGMCQKGNQITGSALCGAGEYSRAGICYKQVQTPVYKPKYANDYIFNNKKYRDTAYCEGDSAPGYNGAYETAYKKAVDRRNSQLSMLSTCSTMNTPYTLQPNVSLNYGGDSKYSFNGNLVMSSTNNVSATPISTPKNGTNCSNGNCVIYQYTCKGNYQECSSTKVYGATVNNVSVSDKTTTTTKIVSYKLPPGGYQYVDKITGEVHKTLPSNIRSTNTYIDLQQSVLPISIDRASGQYDISLTFNNVGNVGGNALFDVKSPYSGVYSCKYNVKNQVLCSIDDCPIGKKAEGLDVIYRPISLTRPFPDDDGKGRNTGSNWCSSGDCGQANSQVNEYILKNRNVTGDAVYKLQPLYSITLTPSVIKQIRNYNRTTNYSDFNLTCKNGGTSCLSNFVQSSGYGFTGKCVGKSVNDFMPCADKRER